MWDVFMDQFEVLATKAPVMLVAGNHERDFPSSGDRFNTASDSGETTQNPVPIWVSPAPGISACWMMQ